MRRTKILINYTENKIDGLITTWGVNVTPDTIKLIGSLSRITENEAEFKIELDNLVKEDKLKKLESVDNNPLFEVLV